MDMRKLILKAEVLLRPSLWLRNERTDRDFDLWLWKGLDEKPSFTLHPNPLSQKVYTVGFNGLNLWVENEPYADISCRDEPMDRYASRATALRARRLIAPLLREHERLMQEQRRFKPPKEES